jgi:hypothetical protein
MLKSILTSSNLRLVVLVTILLALLWHAFFRRTITKENFDRIQIGMPIEKVESLLGGPPTTSQDVIHNQLRRIADWKTRDAVIVLGLDQDGRVVGASFHEVIRHQSSFSEHLSDLFPWLPIPIQRIRE